MTKRTELAAIWPPTAVSRTAGQKLSIEKLGKNLIASKKRLSRDLQRAAQAIITT